ncbi:Protein CBG10562 [Caenorhabditis briggsae]|uniref:Protein CBG10562 n=1 Tax=Caenorhabditis briggsae TaxID=6238 RepID=A8XBC8_CAEBR|nr:Protein CBG10562 [Caenorhabditis briggsae]CAP29943.2 Protein CBG10562 [Caenorhabditis briggsae]
MSTGHAYQWLTESQKANILEVFFSYEFNHYFIKLELPNGFLHFDYNYEYGSTVVSYEREKLLVEKELAKVFLDDLELILKNQKLKLGQLHMQVMPNIFQEHYQGLQETLNTIFERLEEILTQRSEKLVVTQLFLYPYTVKQGISILKYLDPKELTFFGMRFYQGVEASDMENVLELVEWNRKKRIYFELLIFSITLEHLEVIKKESHKITFDLEGADSEEGETVEEGFENLTLENTNVRKALENYVVLKNVLNELQLFDIQHLRKVNRGIRWLIDAHLHPNPHITKIELIFCHIIELRSIIELADRSTRTFKYLILANEKSQLFQDFQVNMSNQTGPLEVLRIKNLIPNPCKKIDKLFVELQTLLRLKMIRTEKLVLENVSYKNLMAVVPYVNFENLQIENQKDFDIDFLEISTLDQWKKAREIQISGIRIKQPIKEIDIINFSNLEICVESLNSEDVEYLKTNLLLLNSFQKFKILFQTNAIDGSLHILIGEPYRIITVSKKIWYFRIPNSYQYMHLLLDTDEKLDIYKQPIPKMIVFSRVEKGDTPFA